MDYEDANPECLCNRYDLDQRQTEGLSERFANYDFCVTDEELC